MSECITTHVYTYWEVTQDLIEYEWVIVKDLMREDTHKQKGDK